MTEIILVRHGESEMNVIADRVIGGRSNHAQLTPRGYEQARSVGKSLIQRYKSFNILYSSPAVRTQETLRTIAEAAGMSDQSVLVDDRLQELSQGIFEGADRASAWTDTTKARLAADPLNFALEGGESVNQVAERTLAWLQEVGEKYPEQRILVAGHGLAIRSLAGAILGWSHEEILAAPAANVSVTQLTHSVDGTVVGFIGEEVIETHSPLQ